MGKALVINGADFSSNKVTTITFDGIHTESITISQATISASEIGDTYQLQAVIVPSDSIDPVQWITSDANVASVSNGLVTINGCGTCTISAKSGSYTATCSVTVEVELTGFVVEPGTNSRPLNSINDIPGYDIGKNPTSGNVSYKNRASTIAIDTTEQRLCSNYAFMTGTDSSATLKPAEQRGWGYLNYGWLVPVILPNNCTKIEVHSLNSNYGSIPLFYKSNVLCSYYSEYICHRKPTGWQFTSTTDVSNGPWEFAQTTEYDVPSGYDSVNVSWYIPTESVDTSSPQFTDMASEQLASFRIICK